MRGRNKVDKCPVVKTGKEIEGVKEKKIKSDFWLKGLAVLLIIMIIFTIVSRAAASFTVAKVIVSNPSSRRIQHTVSVEGRIEKNREISVLTEPDLLVKSVLVSEGQRVEKGEVLAYLDPDSLKERIESVQDEKKALELQNQASNENKNLELKKQKQNAERAQQDYEDIKEKNEAAVKRAENDLEEAKAVLEKHLAENREEEVLSEDRAVLEEKQRAYEDACETKQEEEKAAQRAVEDANTEASADHSADINDISIQNLESEIEKLEAIQDQQGQISAPESGVITGLYVNVGQKTSETAAFTMTDDSAGLKFTGQVSMNDSNYVSVGDTGVLQTADTEVENIEITSMEPDESNAYMTVTAFLPAGTVSLGQTASVEIVQESENYSCVVPLAALRQENGKYFVLLAETEDTILGEQLTARKMEVKVVEKNETYAALEAGALSEESQIITDTDRYVEEGSRVRLMEE